jgi:uncharacterized protein (DUF4415 family)
MASRGKPSNRSSTDRKGDADGKVPVRLWFDSDILDHFRAGGEDWQDRINDTLR